MANLNEPILPGTAATDYERYLRTDELLSLQKSAQEVSHRDEHLFQAVHQTSELWLKFACGELEDATPLVESAQVAEAIRLLRRANDTLSLVIDQLHMSLAARGYSPRANRSSKRRTFSSRRM